MENSLRSMTVPSMVIGVREIPQLQIDMCIFGFEMVSTSGIFYHPRLNSEALAVISNPAYKDIIAIGESWKIRNPMRKVKHSRVSEFQPAGLSQVITDTGTYPCKAGKVGLGSVATKWKKRFDNVDSNNSKSI